MHCDGAFEWTIAYHNGNIVCRCLLKDFVDFICAVASDKFAVYLQNLIAESKPFEETKANYFTIPKRMSFFSNLPNQSCGTIFANERYEHTVIDVTNSQTDFVILSFAHHHFANSVGNLSSLQSRRLTRQRCNHSS